MVDLIEELRQRARHLHVAARAGDPDALEALGAVPDIAETPREARRRPCLTALARRLGFQGWPHAKTVLEGDSSGDLGELMHRGAGGAYWHVWSAHYDEAVTIREAHGGTLLPYRRHFFIVEPPYLRSIGLDPDDPDWDRIGRDFVRPRDREAWTRIAREAVRARLDGYPVSG